MSLMVGENRCPLSGAQGDQTKLGGKLDPDAGVVAAHSVSKREFLADALKATARRDSRNFSPIRFEGQRNAPSR